MVERLIRVGHLRRYVRETASGAEVAPAVERIMANADLPPEPRLTINYILGGLIDDQYQFKCQKRRLLRAPTARALVNTIHVPDSSRAIQPITPHHDALVLTLCINDFNVHRVLVNRGSTADLLQLSAFRQMNISFDKLSSVGRILSRFNGVTTVTIGDIALPVKVRPVVQ